MKGQKCGTFRHVGYYQQFAGNRRLPDKKNTDAAHARINLLEKQYHQVADELFPSVEFMSRSYELLRQHFTYIRSFTQDLFTANEVKCIVAQGELLSTALFELYCRECGF